MSGGALWGSMKSATLDTSAVIATFDPARDGHPAMQRLKEAWEAGRLRLCVSRRTLAELQEKPQDEKLAFAQKLETLPYYMIGTWDDFEPGITWSDLAGTWNDAKVNEALQKALPVRAKVKLRDRGIIIDSMRAGVALLVTTDSFLLARADAIENATGVRPVHPDNAVSRLLSDQEGMVAPQLGD